MTQHEVADPIGPGTAGGKPRSLIRAVLIILFLQHVAAIGWFGYIVWKNRSIDARSGLSWQSDWQRDQEFGIIGLINISFALSISAGIATLILTFLPPDRRSSRILLRLLWIAAAQALWLVPCASMSLSIFEIFWPPVQAR